MARQRKHHVQQSLYLGDANAKRRRDPSGRRRRRRPGVKLGRPPKGARSSERHEVRPELRANQAVHVTLRASDELGRMRTRDVYDAIRWATIALADRASCRIVHLSIQHNHLHLLVEADNKLALARGMQAFQISAARRINVAVSKGRSRDIGWWDAKMFAVAPQEAASASGPKLGADAAAKAGSVAGRKGASAGRMGASAGRMGASAGCMGASVARGPGGSVDAGSKREVDEHGMRWWNAKTRCWVAGRRKGAVFPDRYHEQIIASPRQARNALCYVLNNWRKHREAEREVAAGWLLDPFSSGWAFGGWAERDDSPFAWKTRDTYAPMLTAYPQTWLLREGWRRGGGPVSVFAVPHGHRAAASSRLRG